MHGGRLGNSGGSPTRGSVSRAQSLARILREERELHNNPSPYFHAQPLEKEDPFEWHFTLMGPDDSDFAGGVYHGKILLPSDYPFAPPSVMLLTPNGRFEVGKKVCLSASSFHPEMWQPAWGIRTILEALRAFFPSPGEGAIRALDWDSESRKRIAQSSGEWVCKSCGKSNRELIAEFCPEPTAAQAAVKLPSDLSSVPIKFALEAPPSGQSPRSVPPGTTDGENRPPTMDDTSLAGTVSSADSPLSKSVPQVLAQPPVNSEAPPLRAASRSRPSSPNTPPATLSPFQPVLTAILPSYIFQLISRNYPRTRLDVLTLSLDLFIVFLLGSMIALAIDFFKDIPSLPMKET